MISTFICLKKSPGTNFHPRPNSLHVKRDQPHPLPQYELGTVVLCCHDHGRGGAGGGGDLKEERVLWLTVSARSAYHSGTGETAQSLPSRHAEMQTRTVGTWLALSFSSFCYI